jgi:NAD(P)-dependent dehydrogenase (short-subunit alcohol dehydrogenase family)
MSKSMDASLPRSPSTGLAGKRALVIGAGRGIGFGCAAALAEAGAHVVLAARTENQVEATAAAILQA